MLMLSHKVWRHSDVMLCGVRKRSMTVWRVNFTTFTNAKKMSLFFNISQGAQLAYKIYPIKNLRDYPDLNTVKILFKWPKNIKTRLPYPYLAPYNTREEGQHRKTSVNPENRNVWHTKKCYDAFVHWFFPDLQGRFGWFVTLLLWSLMLLYGKNLESH